jgi:hypothetical protein
MPVLDLYYVVRIPCVLRSEVFIKLTCFILNLKASTGFIRAVGTKIKYPSHVLKQLSISRL